MYYFDSSMYLCSLNWNLLIFGSSKMAAVLVVTVALKRRYCRAFVFLVVIVRTFEAVAILVVAVIVAFGVAPLAVVVAALVKV